MRRILIPSLDIVICTVFCFLAITPFFNHNYLSLIAIFGAALIISLLVIYGLKNGFRIDSEIGTIIFLILIWFSIEIGYRVNGYSSASWGNYFIRLGFYVPLLVGVIYVKYNVKGIDIVILVSLVISIIDNIRLGILYPNILQYITSDISNTYRGSLNLGTAAFGYCVLLAQYIIFYNICNHTINGFRKAVYIIIAVCSVIYLVFLSSATLLTLLFVIDAYIYIRFPHSENRKTIRIKIERVLFFGILLILALIFKNWILNILGEKFSNRFNAIVYGNNRSIYYTRPELAFVSLKSWLNSIKTFLIGGGLHLDSSDLYSFSGQHSAIIDQLAYYGILGWVIPGMIFYRFYNYIKVRINPSHREIFKIVCVICIIGNIINSSCRIESGIINFMFVPLSLMKHQEDIL